MADSPHPNLSPNEAKVISQIKNLTKKCAYGNIVIVIKAGRITAIQVTQDIRTDTSGQPQS